MTKKLTKQPSIPNFILWGALLITLLFIAAPPLRNLWTPSFQSSEKGLPVYGEIPAFTLTERSGKIVTLSDLEGKVWVADFIFTHCAGPCPLISAQMSQLARQFQKDPRVRFVSFSVDPDRDTPEVLSKYAGRYQADPDQWLFLTGDKTVIYRLTEQHFHLGVAEIPLAEREAVDQTVSHSTKFALVDNHRRIRGYYDGESKADLDKLIHDAENLLKTLAK